MLELVQQLAEFSRTTNGTLRGMRDLLALHEDQIQILQRQVFTLESRLRLLENAAHNAANSKGFS